ncbi:TetR/AcrR family transcriptional regulator [Nocardia stercoris]|uniref:TetR family transcriptional regulator n=1 Tax=Nocardia stercoris TaxID=2483361 RepID=A0A3M2LCW6_9NOCA|nr:TetR family transcriptional regulator [Nocardia stercoris]RMI35332.1 TetR family transcriptional regulator [Nocardia stercoris]
MTSSTVRRASDATETLAERKRAVTRRALAAVALELAVEHGLENVTVPAIAAAAGVSARTFNNYFSSKEEAVVAPIFDRATRIVEAFERRPADEPLWQAVTSAIVAQFSDEADVDLGSNAATRAAMNNPALRGEQLKACAAIEELLAAAIAARGDVPASDITPRLVAGTAITAARIAFDHWNDAHTSSTLRAAITQALDIAGGNFTTLGTQEIR